MHALSEFLIHRKIPRRIALVGFWLLLPGIALFPFLFLGRLFIDADATLYYYPVFDFYHTAIKLHQSFLLNPSIFLGFPTYLSQSAGFFDPVNWLLFHLPTFTAYHLRLMLDLFLVLLFSYGAGRELGRTRLASLLIGTGYILAFNWRYLSNVVIANSLFLLPFLWYAGLKLFTAKTEKSRWLWIISIGSAIGWSLLSGYAQFVIYALFVFSLFYIWYFFYRLPGKKDIYAMMRWGAYGLIAVGIGFLLALPQVLPAIEFTPLTLRANGVAYESAIYKTVAPGDIILFAFPDYLYFPYLSGGRKPLYIGALLFLLALVGMREALRIRRKKEGEERNNQSEPAMRIFVWLFAFCFIASLQWSPLFYLMQKLPVFELFRFPYRWMYVGAWFLCVLGAYGFDVFYNRLNELRKSWLTRVVAAVCTGIVLIVVALNFLGTHFWSTVSKIMEAIFSRTVFGHGPFTKDITHYHEAFDRGIAAWQSFLSLKDVSFAIPFFILVFSVAFLAATLSGMLSREKSRWIGFLISVITFISVFAVQWPYSVPRSATLLHTQLLDSALSAQELEMYRTFPFRLGDSLSAHIQPTYRLSRDQIVAIAEMQFATGWPNMHIYDGSVASVDGYDPFAPVDMLKVLSLVGSTHAGQEVPAQDTRTNTERLVSNLDVLGMLSGKFIISGAPLTHPHLSLRATSTVSHLDGFVYIYENQNALPRWYFAERIVEKSHDSLSALLEDSTARSFVTQTYLDCNDCAVPGTASRNDSITVTGQTFAKYEFATYSEAPRWFVFTESSLPGWHLSIDGVQTPITRANGMLMAAYIPAGDHQVAWEYLGVLGEGNLLKRLGVFR